MATKTISAEVRTTIDKPLAEVFAKVVPIDLTTIFRGRWPLPAVVGTTDQSGPWNQPDQTRTVLLADKTTAKERLLVVDSDSYFSYRVDGFTGALGRLADHANGQWWFEPTADGLGTVVRWRYEFVPESRCSAIALRAIVKLFWKPYMNEAIEATKIFVEQDTPKVSAASR